MPNKQRKVTNEPQIDTKQPLKDSTRDGKEYRPRDTTTERQYFCRDI